MAFDSFNLVLNSFKLKFIFWITLSNYFLWINISCSFHTFSRWRRSFSYIWDVMLSFWFSRDSILLLNSSVVSFILAAFACILRKMRNQKTFIWFKRLINLLDCGWLKKGLQWHFFLSHHFRVGNKVISYHFRDGKKVIFFRRYVRVHWKNSKPIHCRQAWVFLETILENSIIFAIATYNNKKKNG